jgi:deazaflavin-dependent oxidoreductase (nitroreductase family)
MSTTNTRTVDNSSSDDNSRRLDFNASNIAEFRAIGGKIASFGDAPVLLLTTIGAKSGAKRVNPMMYLADARDPDRVYVFASKAGADTNPAWLGNLVAYPQDLTVEIGSETLSANAELLAEPARSATFAVQAARYPGFAGYQAKTKRVIPVVALTLRRSS